MVCFASGPWPTFAWSWKIFETELVKEEESRKLTKVEVVLVAEMYMTNYELSFVKSLLAPMWPNDFKGFNKV